MHNKKQSQDRLSSRQIERKMLTFRSNQPGLQMEEALTLG